MSFWEYVRVYLIFSAIGVGLSLALDRVKTLAARCYLWLAAFILFILTGVAL